MKTLFVLLVFIQFVTIAQTNWTTKSASIKFKIKNGGLIVDGTFFGFSSNIIFDENNLSASIIEGSVETKTIETGIGIRNNHLKKDEYFSADKYPKITIKSTKIEKDAAGLKGVFQLTIKGITKKMEIPFTFENNTLNSTFTIQRSDFKVGSSSWVMADDVILTIKIDIAK